MRRRSGFCSAVVAAVMAGAVLSGGVGCKPSNAVKEAQGIDSGTGQVQPAAARLGPIDPATLGGVSGTVRLDGKAPQRVKIDMSMDPVCSMLGGENLSEQYVVKDGKLANVYVYVKSGPPSAMGYAGPTPAPVVLDQVGCRYVPHVVAVMRGGTVEFRNSDSTMHNIHTMPTVVGSQSIDISQGPKGEPQRKQFNQVEEMIPVRCNNHPWMNAFINVSATPFFAVTDEDGRFTIAGLPAGTYTLGVVHEKLGEQTVTVTVAAQKTAKADIGFSVTQ